MTELVSRLGSGDVATWSFAAVVEGAYRATLLFVLAAVAAWLLRHRAAALRHAVWVALFALLLALPALGAVLPGWHVLPIAWSRSPDHSVTGNAEHATRRADGEPRVRSREDVTDHRSARPPETPTAVPRDVETDRFPGDSRTGRKVAAAPARVAFEVAPRISGEATRRAIVGVWLAGCGLCLLKLLLGAVRLARATRTARPVLEGALRRHFDALRGELQLPDRVQLFIGRADEMPAAWGILRPRILVPSEIVTWPADRCRAVLLHELGHIARRDPLWQLLIELGKAAYWFHPLVWVAAARAGGERERACDELVLSRGVSPRDYARHILAVLAGRTRLALPAALGVPMASAERIERRIRHLFFRPRADQRASRVAAALPAIVLAALALPLAALRAQAPPAAGAIANKQRDAITGSAAAPEKATPRNDFHGDPIGFGAALRLGSVRYRLDQFVGFGPDDKTLVGIDKGQVVLLEVATGRRMHELPNYGMPVEKLFLAPDRKTAFSYGTTVDPEGGLALIATALWDLENPRLRARHTWSENPKEFVSKVAVTPDFKTVAIGNNMGTVEFRDAATGKKGREELVRYGDHIQAIEFSPDGQTAALSCTGELRFLDWKSDREAVKLSAGRHVKSIAFSPDGAFVAEGPDSRSNVELRDLVSHQVLRGLANPERESLLVRSMAFSADGRQLAASNSQGIVGGIKHRLCVWDTATGEVRHKFSMGVNVPGHVDLSRDGRLLAASLGAEVLLWDLTTGQAARAELASHSKEIWRICAAPDGTFYVTCAPDGTARIWDAETGGLNHVLKHAADWVPGIAVSPDSRHVATSALDSTVRLWDARSGQEIYSLAGPRASTVRRPLAFSADGRRLASWSDDFDLRVWDVKTGKAVEQRHVHFHPQAEKRLRDDQRGELPRELEVDAAEFSVDALWLALSQGPAIHRFELNSGKMEQVYTADGEIRWFALSPGGSQLAVVMPRNVETPLAHGRVRWGPVDYSVRVFDIDSKSHVWRQTIAPYATRAAYSLDGRLLAVASTTDEGPSTVHIYDVQSGDEIQEIHCPARVFALCFAADGRRIACGLGDGTALIFELHPAARR